MTSHIPFYGYTLLHSMKNYDSDFDSCMMQLAVDSAENCIPSHSAFSVGAVLTKGSQVLFTGFSREIPGNTHAEQVCFIKLAKSMNINILGLYPQVNPDFQFENPLKDVAHSATSSVVSEVFKTCTIYTTMEPCGERLSGNKPCAHWIKELGISRVVVGILEPANFIKETNGVQYLRSNGIKVDFIDGFEGFIYFLSF